MPVIALATSQPGWLRKAQFVSKSDVKFLYDEIHVKRSYEQMGVRLENRNTGGGDGGGGGGGTVLDIGANIGMFATRAAEALGSLEVTYCLVLTVSLRFLQISKIINFFSSLPVFFLCVLGRSHHSCRASPSYFPSITDKYSSP